MQIIGSKAAAELAKKKLGPKAYAMRSGRRYYIGKIFVNPCRLFVGNIVGTGKSWSEALKHAGITPPDPLGQVIEKVQQEGGGE